MSKRYELDDLTDLMLSDLSKKWRMKAEDILKEQVRESYINSNGGKLRK